MGGWASKGVDPAIYARALMSGAELFSNDHPDIYDPVQIMQAGYPPPLSPPFFHFPFFHFSLINDVIYVNAAQHLGSSTCCIVVLNPQKQPPHLNSANLGDSGFMVIRDNTIVYLFLSFYFLSFLFLYSFHCFFFWFIHLPILVS